MLGLAVLLMLVLTAALAGPASAKAMRTQFVTTSVATFGPQGKVTECPPYVYIQGNKIVATDNSVHPNGSLEPRLCGLRYVTENLRINTETGMVVGWGTYRLVVGTFHNGVFKPTGGIWAGTFTEKIDLTTGLGTGTDCGYGVKGNVAGLQVKATTELHPYPDGTGAVVYETGCIVGR
jgi:hypothetical protein